MPWIYIVRCTDGFYYTGSTWDLAQRIDQHNAGAGGSMFTRRRLPVELVFAQEFERIDDAWAAERQVHGWSRAKKEALISGRFDLLPALSRNRHNSDPDTASRTRRTTRASDPSTSSGTGERHAQGPEKTRSRRRAPDPQAAVRNNPPPIPEPP